MTTTAATGPRPEVTASRRRWPRWVLRTAAVVVLVLGAATWWFFDGPGRRYHDGTASVEAARVDGTSVVLTFTGGKLLDDSELCGEDYEATVDETDRAVTVTLQRYRLRPPPPFRPYSCTMEGYPRRVAAPLDEPLGDRVLVDGTTGDTIDVE